MKLKFSILFLFGIWQFSQAQNFFEARLDTDRVLIGVPVTLTLYAEVNPNETYIWPAFTDSINGLEIWESGELSEKTKGDKKQIEQKLTVASFDSGYYVIKPIALTVAGDSLFTDPVLVQVNTVALAEETEFYGIKDPVKAPTPWGLILAIAGGVLVLIAIIIYFVKRLRKTHQPQAKKTEDTRTPLEKLRDNLNRIKSEQNWEKNTKLFYSQLSDAIKQYMEDEYRFAALESTTVQLKPVIMGLNWKPQTRLVIIELLAEADMVKFAKANPVVETRLKQLVVFEDWYREMEEIEKMLKVQNTVVNA